jgi:hypothetical protein
MSVGMKSLGHSERREASGINVTGVRANVLPIVKIEHVIATTHTPSNAATGILEPVSCFRTIH